VKRSETKLARCSNGRSAARAAGSARTALNSRKCFAEGAFTMHFAIDAAAPALERDLHGLRAFD
jgi:hypothetical protein